MGSDQRGVRERCVTLGRILDRVVKRVLLLLAILAVIGVAGVLSVGSRLVAPVQCSVGTPPPDLLATPVSFSSASGAEVSAWYSKREGARGVVLLLPGVRANRLSMLNRARFLRAADYSVLLVDLQGTGETKGSHITFGWLESRDVEAAVAFVRKEEPGLPVAILGTSLGGAAALFALPRMRPDALVLEAVYPTIERATANRLRLRFGVLGLLGTPLLLGQLRPRIGVSASNLRPMDYITGAGCPVLILSGAADKHTTIEDTMLLFARAKDPKSLWIVAGAAHVDLHRAAGADYEKRVLSFLEASMAVGT
jgi:uncharacterized protein